MGTAVSNNTATITMAAETPVPSHLIVREGPLAGRSFHLGKTVTIGRNPDNAICLDNHKVSRQHARISGENGRYFIEDLGSSNGTLLNGQRVEQKTSLQVGDRLTVGDTLFELAGRAQPEPAACPTCHQLVPVTASFCRYCGGSLA